MLDSAIPTPFRVLWSYGYLWSSTLAALVIPEAWKTQMSSTVVPASVGEGQSAPDMGSEGLDTLLGSSEASFSDDTMDSNAKLSLFVGSVRKFLAGEPGKANVLGGGLDGSVSSHATFGRMKATVMMSCTCNHMKGGGNDPNPKGAQGAVCCLHIDSPSLADLIFVLSSTVYSVFDDSFMCFANLLVDNVSAGMVRPPLFSFLMIFLLLIKPTRVCLAANIWSSFEQMIPQYKLKLRYYDQPSFRMISYIYINK